ncbi:hypothetical protein SDC9_15167 [bioreactor metagenome]|uniref:Uncharacterized protein n=1 Tax=bioreactor metagenome TaxID=1076179 RepID=A0A644TR67_9ZZZZ|nr:hypothetical protein [Desulfitobacterium hafniense]MEA5023919.1 hypothetical protein [Desulfitobacterium hafniense]
MKKIFFVLLIFTFLVVGCGSENLIDEAQFYVQEKVKANLKSPSTAKFSKWDDSLVKKLDDNKYSVKGYVDAQNGFGATVRSNYYAEVIFVNEDEYRVENLVID